MDSERCDYNVHVMDSIAENIERLRDKVSAAAQKAGRDPAGISLVAVTKTVDIDRIGMAIRAGIRDLGENYYQEAREKISLFGPDVHWHFIGHLQTNKVRHVAGQFALVHSIDSERLAEELGRRAAAIGIIQPVLIEVKLDPSAAKHGVETDRALELANRVTAIDGIRLVGLMGMAPFDAGGESAHPYFSLLRKLFEALPEANRKVLSMGMTADFEAAICEGSTMIRIGTAIFGTR